MFGVEGFGVGRWGAGWQVDSGVKLPSRRHWRGECLGHSVWPGALVTPVSSLHQARPSQGRGLLLAPRGLPWFKKQKRMNTFKDELVEHGLFFSP